jgi:hypothetical protein
VRAFLDRLPAVSNVKATSPRKREEHSTEKYIAIHRNACANIGTAKNTELRAES